MTDEPNPAECRAVYDRLVRALGAATAPLGRAGVGMGEPPTLDPDTTAALDAAIAVRQQWEGLIGRAVGATSPDRLRAADAVLLALCGLIEYRLTDAPLEDLARPALDRLAMVAENLATSLRAEVPARQAVLARKQWADPDVVAGQEEASRLRLLRAAVAAESLAHETRGNTLGALMATRRNCHRAGHRSPLVPALCRNDFGPETRTAGLPNTNHIADMCVGRWRDLPADHPARAHLAAADLWQCGADSVVVLTMDLKNTPPLPDGFDLATVRRLTAEVRAAWDDYRAGQEHERRLREMAEESRKRADPGYAIEELKRQVAALQAAHAAKA